jgi:hypothetical protein
MTSPLGARPGAHEDEVVDTEHYWLAPWVATVHPVYGYEQWNVVMFSGENALPMSGSLDLRDPNVTEGFAFVRSPAGPADAPTPLPANVHYLGQNLDRTLTNTERQGARTLLGINSQGGSTLKEVLRIMLFTEASTSGKPRKFVPSSDGSQFVYLGDLRIDFSV